MKWNYTTIQFFALTELELSALEYILSDIIYHRTKSGTEWWAYSPTDLGDLLGVSENTIRDAIARCVEKGTVNKDGKQVISCQKYIDVVYPSNGINSRLDGRNSHSATGETPAHYNYIGKKDYRFAGVVISHDSEQESGDSKSPRISGDKLKAYNELVRWSEKERGFPFLKTHILKQYKAFKIANENGITRDQLMAKWEDMSGEKFWMKNGFDWMNVIEEFNKKSI